MGSEMCIRDRLRIEQAAPTWMSFQSQPRQIVGELRHRAANPPRLTALAERMGLARV